MVSKELKCGETTFNGYDILSGILDEAAAFADPDTWPLAETWEDCVRHVEAGGVVEMALSGSGEWVDDIYTVATYRSISRPLHRTDIFCRRRLVPIPAPESSPDGRGGSRGMSELREKMARVFCDLTYEGDIDWSDASINVRQEGYRYADAVLAIPEVAAALTAPTLSEGMTPERLLEMAARCNGAGLWGVAGRLRRWADDLAAQIEGGGGSPTTAPDDPFPVGCRVRDDEGTEGTIAYHEYTRMRLSDGNVISRLKSSLTRIDPEPVVTAEPSPDGEGEDSGDAFDQLLVDSLSDLTDNFGARGVLVALRKLHPGCDLAPEAERDALRRSEAAMAEARKADIALIEFLRSENVALATRLTVWPEGHEGHEVLVVPKEVVDEYAGTLMWVQQTPETQAQVQSAARAAVARRLAKSNNGECS